MHHHGLQYNAGAEGLFVNPISLHIQGSPACDITPVASDRAHFGCDNWTFLAAAIAMGATVVRVGFEDSHYLDEGVDAEYNWQVVEKLVNLIRAMGLEPATPDEARKMLNMHKR